MNFIQPASIVPETRAHGNSLKMFFAVNLCFYQVSRPSLIAGSLIAGWFGYSGTWVALSLSSPKSMKPFANKHTIGIVAKPMSWRRQQHALHAKKTFVGWCLGHGTTTEFYQFQQ
jgi:hypothetical protein